MGMDGTLGTTNALLAILAAVAVLEVIALIAASVVGWILFRNLRDLMQEVRRQVPKLTDRVDGLATQLEDVLTDVKGVSARTAATAERLHHGFDAAADVASMAVSSAQLFMGRKASIATGVLRGLGVAYRILMQNRPSRSRTRPAARETEDRPSGAADARTEETTFKEAAHGV
jgi:uncharacterized protein YoxC